MPCTPSLPSSGQRSRGNVLLRSISSARGAMRSAAKPHTLSRSMSAVSPKPKSKPRGSFTRMGADLVCAARPRRQRRPIVRVMHVLDRARPIAGRRRHPRAFYSAAATWPAPCAKGPARQQCRVADPRGAAEKRMKLGAFTMPVHPPARRYVETLKEDREAFILADPLGYMHGSFGEALTEAA